MSAEIKNILITDDVDGKCVEILQTNGFNVIKNIKLTKEELKEEIKVITHFKLPLQFLQ
jgi:hypothetical protein